MRLQGQISRQKLIRRHLQSRRSRFANPGLTCRCGQHQPRIKDRFLVLTLCRLLPLVLILFHGKVAGFVYLAQLSGVLFGGVKPVLQP